MNMATAFQTVASAHEGASVSASLSRQTRGAAADAILPALQIEDTLAATNTLLRELETSLIARIRAGRAVQAGKEDLEQRKALVFLNGAIDGKNEKQREAQLVLALAANTEYKKACKVLDEIDEELGAASIKVELAQRALDANKAKLRIIAATLELLAGS